MGYENAPATRILATHCVCCGRPLVDAVSVETGVGPDCRKKYGYAEGPEEYRQQANQLVWQAATNWKHPNLVMQLAQEIKELGFLRLGQRLLDRLITVHIVERNGALSVETPYNPAAVESFRRIPGRRWTDGKNVIPLSSKGSLFTLLQTHYRNHVAMGPKGLFVIAA
jgi:hypothetical protein